jgi:hypothetical protein
MAGGAKLSIQTADDDTDQILWKWARARAVAADLGDPHPHQLRALPVRRHGAGAGRRSAGAGRRGWKY